MERVSAAGRLETVAVAAPVVFLAATVLPGIDFTFEEGFITTPALGISGSWAAAALPVGAALMPAVALLRLARVGSWRLLAAGAGTVLAVALGFMAAAPVLHDLGNINLLIFFVGLVGITVLAGVPIAFAFRPQCLVSAGGNAGVGGTISFRPRWPVISINRRILLCRQESSLAVYRAVCRSRHAPFCALAVSAWLIFDCRGPRYQEANRR
jgi:hypothetical protein